MEEKLRERRRYYKELKAQEDEEFYANKGKNMLNLDENSVQDI